MNGLKAWWGKTWRIGVCMLLLLWIFHSIFLNDSRIWAQNAGMHWEQMSRGEQWHLAWTRGPQDLWKTLTSVHPVALITSVALVGVTLWIGVVRWRIVLEAQGLHLPLGRATNISMVAQFFNSFLLGSTGGDFIKAYYAARETHHKKTEAVTTVFVDRLIGLWSMLFFAGVMMIPNWQMLAHHKELGAAALMILAMLVAVTGILSVAFWGGVSKRFPKARHFLRRIPKGVMLEKSLDSCRQFGQAKGLLYKTVALSLAANIAFVFQISVLGGGLDLNIPFSPLLVIVPTILCISAVPITPNGLGVRENLYVIMLAVLAIPRTGALSVSLLASAEGLFWSLIGGLVYMGLRDKEHLSEVTKASAPANT